MPKAKVRGNGDGSIFQRKDTGKWVAELMIGKRADGSRDVLREQFGTRDLARAWLIKRLGERNEGIVTKPTKLTISAWLDLWMTTIVAHDCKATTQNTYRWIIESHLKPAFGNTPLSKLQPQQVQKLYHERLEANLSTPTIRSMHSVLHKALDVAKRQGMVATNVCDHVQRPRVKQRRMTIFDQEQGKRFLKFAAEDKLYALYVVTLYLGLRLGEVTGLRWSDIDWKEGTLTVAQTVANLHGKAVFSTPKSEAGNRTFDLPPAVIVALKKHQEAQKQECKTTEREWTAWGLVFCTLHGTPLNPTNIRVRSFNPVLVAAKLPRIRFHDLRHTAISAMAAIGATPTEMAEYAGHSDVTTTLKVYTQVHREKKRETAQKVGAFWGASKTKAR